MGVVLACDLGGTSFRACLVDDVGTVKAQAVLPSPQAEGRNGVAEIAPEAWWSCLLQVTAELARQEPALFRSIAAMAICGVTRSQVFLDATGAVIRPAMTWNDTRAAALATKLAAEWAGRHSEAEQVNAFHPLARLAWLKASEPDRFARVALVLDPKDYLNVRLTGKAASDPVSLARLLAAAQTEQGGNLLTICGIPGTILPKIISPFQQVGLIQPGLPDPLGALGGIPVYCCSNDTWAAVAGLGALRASYAYNISGTTEVLGVMSEAPVQAAGLLTVDWGGLWQQGGPSLNGADTMSWLLALLGQPAVDVAATLEALLGRPRQSQPLLFLPYLQGERVPFWNPSLRGAFIGLGRQHGPADLAWAVMEGVAFLNREVLERAEAALGWRVGCIRFGGGGASNPVWCQIKTDICGRPVETCAAAEPGVLGAAAVAWTGLGRFASLAEAQERLVSVSRCFTPDPAKAARYDGLFALFQRASAALAPISERLVGMAPGD